MPTKYLIQGQLVAALIDILRLMDENHYRQLWDNFADDKKALKVCGLFIY